MVGVPVGCDDEVQVLNVALLQEATDLVRIVASVDEDGLVCRRSDEDRVPLTDVEDLDGELTRMRRERREDEAE